MIQEIITYGIVSAALLYTVYSVYVSLKPNSKKTVCGTCSGCDISRKSSCHV